MRGVFVLLIASIALATNPGRAFAQVARVAKIDVPSGQASRRAAVPLVITDADEVPVQETVMYLGEARTFKAPNIARIAVGNGGVLSSGAIDQREVLVFANAVGISSLTVWDASGRQATAKITVIPADTTRVLREVRDFLARLPHLRADVVGDKVIVDGDDLSDSDQEKLGIIAQRYPQIVSFASRVGWERMVRLAVEVVELPVSEESRLGVDWSSPTQGGLNLGIASDLAAGGALTGRPGEQPVALPFRDRGVNGYFGINALLTSKINLLAQEGNAVVLAAPTLSTRSGSPASFLSGGEIPYAGASATGTPNVQFKPYGVKLDITPRVDVRTGTIRSVIETEVSDVDPSLVTSVGPALLTRRTRTEFNVREGQTMVLSGFRQRRHSHDVKKIPGLGDLPLVGSLFRSKTFIDKETTLLILVTPTLVDPTSSSVQGDIDRAHDATRDLDRLPARSAPTVMPPTAAPGNAGRDVNLSPR